VHCGWSGDTRRLLQAHKGLLQTSLFLCQAEVHGCSEDACTCTAADVVGEMVGIGESTCLNTTVKFARTVVVFGPEYLREPNAQDTEKLLAIGEARGFPGMLGSIDCMHWQWKNCPKGLRGMYQGHTREATIILEAVASHDLWIWHAFFGMPGSHNDINVLQRSPVFRRLCNGESPPCNYTVNGRDYNMGYYLADGIYPQ